MQIIKFSKYIIGLFFLCTISACDEEALNLAPHDSLSSATFWKTEKDATMALTGCYNALYGSYFNMDSHPVMDCLSDNAWAWNNDLGAKSAMMSPINATTGGVVTGFYSNTYGQIGTCNYFLENVDKVAATADKINLWKAEVLFMRAFYYFHLSEFYGGVPLILHPFAVTDPLIPKSSKEAVVKQILEDLETALRFLPEVAYTDGHAVKGAALLLKAKVLLYNQQYQEAANTAKLIMSSGKFGLYANYQNMFLPAGQGSDNKEIMFSVKYLAPNFQNNSTLRFGWWMAVLPLQNHVDDYEAKDGLPIGQSKVYDPLHPYDNRDPRLSQTVMLPGSSYGFQGEAPEYADWTPRIAILTKPLKYNLRKYVDPAKNSTDAGGRCDNDVVLLRYADVLLTFAEAQNEAVGPGSEVYAAIDQVRVRSGMPIVRNDPSTVTQAGLREKIRRERRVEFAFEGQRLLDLKRWKIADQKINSVDVTQAPTKYVFQPHNYLWPFPQSEIDFYKNHGDDLGQNAGY